MSARLRASLALAIGVAATAWAGGCGSFEEGSNPGTTTTDGGGDAGTADGDVPDIAKRDLEIVAEWPDDGSLDPSQDTRVTSITVTVRDAVSTIRTVKAEGNKGDRGPWEFRQFESARLVHVMIELRGPDGRLLGYGQTWDADLAASTKITVPVRKRLLYAIMGDGMIGAELDVVAFDLTPSTAELSFSNPGLPVVKLPTASALTLSRDARLLAIAHAPTGSSGKVAVFKTTDHQSLHVVDLDFAPRRMLLFNEKDVLVMPGATSNTAALARVNLETKDVKPVQTGNQGGSLVVADAALALDGRSVYVAANYTKNGETSPIPQLLTIDLLTNTPATPIEIAGMSEVTTLRLSADGTRIFVGGKEGAANAPNGIVFEYDLTRTKTVPRPSYANAPVRTLFVHPRGKRIFVSTSTHYDGSFWVGGGFYAYDGSWTQVAVQTTTDQYPEYQLEAAVQLPYEPYRVLASQTDAANDAHGSIVELPEEENVPASVAPSAPIGGTIHSLATPFGRPL